MAAQLIREWTTIRQFPAATQEKLVDLLAKLKNQNVSTLTILITGKVVLENLPQLIRLQGNEWSLLVLFRFLLNKRIDALLYVDRLDEYRVNNLDKQVVKAIIDSFGKEIWHKALVVLTHAQLSPSDALSYEEFFYKRSESLLKCVQQGARISKKNARSFDIPVALVENSGRSDKNESDEKILPTGTPWILNLVHMITDMALNGKDGILVDKKLIEGPNANDRGKIFMPVI